METHTLLEWLCGQRLTKNVSFVSSAWITWNFVLTKIFIGNHTHKNRVQIRAIGDPPGPYKGWGRKQFDVLDFTSNKNKNGTNCVGRINSSVLLPLSLKEQLRLHHNKRKIYTNYLSFYLYKLSSRGVWGRNKIKNKN